MATRPPNAVRNFFLEAEIDTKREDRIRRLRGGPRTYKGGMRITLHQRNEGRTEPVLKIICRVGPSGGLQIAVVPLVGPSRNVEVLTTPLTER
jgi:ABC-type phosphonate transport system ATPase subunit